jgi:hypothetical protein
MKRVWLGWDSIPGPSAPEASILPLSPPRQVAYWDKFLIDIDSMVYLILRVKWIFEV